MSNVQPLHVWIDHVFAHPVAKPAWYHPWNSEAAKARPETAEAIAAHIADTFEHSGEMLSRFSDEQLDQGFWYLFFQGSKFMETLLDDAIPSAIRLRALRSFVPLFRQVMEGRCSPNLSHLDEKGLKPLNSSCYMWFDNLLDRFNPERLVQAELDTELALVLRAILAIPHDACKESALHGIGHWVLPCPHLTDIVDQFLCGTPGLRPELVAYAESARAGNVL